MTRLHKLARGGRRGHHTAQISVCTLLVHGSLAHDHQIVVLEFKSKGYVHECPSKYCRAASARAA